MRPVSTILLFQLGCIGAGYLLTEACRTIYFGRDSTFKGPWAAELATTYSPILVLLVICWGAYALYAERVYQSSLARERIPLGLGVLGAAGLLIFEVAAGFSVFTCTMRLSGG